MERQVSVALHTSQIRQRRGQSPPAVVGSLLTRVEYGLVLRLGPGLPRIAALQRSQLRERTC